MFCSGIRARSGQRASFEKAILLFNIIIVKVTEYVT